MNNDQSSCGKPDKKLAAVCGLFCPSCSIYIGTTEDRGRLIKRSELQKRPITEFECYGCRSDKRCFYCDENCKMTKCAAEKGIDFCGECSDYPCSELKEFQALMPHRIELWKNHKRINEVGFEEWYKEMIEDYSCPECHTINSAYDLSCRKCGYVPSCDYVKLHKDEIIVYLKKQTSK